jgi:hypothetical protein
MPPERTLSDADIAALSKALAANHCECSFSDDEVAAVRDLLKLLQETRSNILKGIITVVVGGVFIALALGIKVWAKQ